jgi:hypothetical protein
LIQREPFDYTKWQRELWKDKTVEELSREAMEFRKKKKAVINQFDVEKNV